MELKMGCSLSVGGGLLPILQIVCDALCKWCTEKIYYCPLIEVIAVAHIFMNIS
jgi:hypothetical protein